MITTKIVFDHRGRTKNNEEGPLEVRVTANRRSYYINTGLRVKKNLWVSGKIADMPGWAEFERRINIIRDKIEAEVNNCLEEGRPIVSAEIRRKVWDDGAESGTAFLDWCETQIPVMTISEGTRRHYRTLMARLNEWGGIRTWSDLTTEKIYLFDSWLHQLPTKQKQADVMAGIEAPKISDGCVWNYHKCLKKLLNNAVLFDKLAANPYDRLRGQFNRGDRETVEYLTQQELSIIEHCTPTPGSTMTVVRDLFVFQAYTGFAFGDMVAFDIRDYHEEDGVWVHNGERIKTGVPFVSELLPPVVSVLKRYNMQLPVINNNHYNVLLKAMGEMLGLTKNLTSHMARHTFATMMLKHGAKIENVSAMLGHTNVKQTQRYAKVMAESVHNDFKKVAELLLEEPGTVM